MQKNKANLTGLLFALPFIIGFLVFTLYPISASLIYSFNDFNLFKPMTYVGLDNYKWMFNEKYVGISIMNTFYMVIFATAVSMFFGLLTAQLLNMKVKGQAIFRTFFYIPSIVPVIATSLVWMWVLNPRSGLVNSFLDLIGINGPNWLLDASWTKPSLLLMAAWGCGNVMIIFLSALQGVSRSLYEAAEIDGAGPIRKYLYVTLPSISPIILFQLIMAIIIYFQYFDQAFMLASLSATGAWDQSMSGPENSLLFFSILLYREAFMEFSMGHASAMAWLLFIVTALVTVLVFRTSKKWVTYGGE
jgi:multiple sugar transport system permease protein